MRGCIVNSLEKVIQIIFSWIEKICNSTCFLKITILEKNDYSYCFQFQK